MKEREVVFLAHELHGKVEETHISWVILTRRFVYKIKKPLRLSFLDFSSLRKRRMFCEREIVLNKRFTDIYVSVVPIRSLSNKYIMGGVDGKVVDYTVKMKRMSTARRMDKMLEADEVNGDLIVSLANTIAAAHRQCEPVYKPFKIAEAKALFNDILHYESIIIRSTDVAYADVIRDCIRWSNGFLRSYQKRLQERITCGYQRDVHGDLHTGNIFLYQNPVIFDCIEFNDAFRQIDVLYEIAYLCMDLEAYGKKDLSDKLLSKYNSEFSTFEVKEDEAILNYFKSLRANIRVKVHALAISQVENDNEFAFHADQLLKYLHLMADYSLSDKTL